MLYLINKHTKEHKVLTADSMWSHSDWEVAQADQNGWIAHDGGECPLPNESRCDVKMKGFDSDYKNVQVKGSDWDLPVAMRRAITHYRPILTVYTPPQSVVPEGYVLVPVEPTEAMLMAWFSATRESSEGVGTLGYFRAAYKALLSAGKENNNE
jgi:hypothetical protein